MKYMMYINDVYSTIFITLYHCAIDISKLFLRQLYAEMAKQERQSPERAQEGPLGPQFMCKRCAKMCKVYKV